MTIAARKAALMQRIRDYGGPLNEPAVLAQFLAQVMHESGNLRYVREIWGPTAAQKRYEGRKDLGNTQPGDGKRFMGRDVIQTTGRANYRALTAWVRKTFGAKVDFEKTPEALEGEEWLGISAIWYFLEARKDLIRFCREGNIEMVTRRVNGGLNGYADRLKKYDAAALEILGIPDVRTFQKSAGLTVDGISGPKTRAAMHQALLKHKPATAPQNPAQRESAAPASEAAKGRGGAIPVVLGLLVGGYATVAAWWNENLQPVIDWLVFWQ
jgi:putative chitinase